MDKEATSMETEWKMLIKSVGEGCIMVEIFLMKGSSWSRLSDLLVSLELAILADCPAVPVLPPMPEVTGERLAVSVCQQEAPHPGNLAVTLDEVTQHLRDELAHCEQGGLTRLAEGVIIAVKVGNK